MLRLLRVAANENALLKNIPHYAVSVRKIEHKNGKYRLFTSNAKLVESLLYLALIQL